MLACQCDWEGGIPQISVFVFVIVIVIVIVSVIVIVIVIVIVFVFALLVVKQHANRSKGRWYLSDCYECRSR